MKIVRINSKNLERRSREIEKSASHFDPELVSRTEKNRGGRRESRETRRFFATPRKFDGAHVTSKNVKVADREFEEARAAVSPGIARDLRKAASRIRSYQKKEASEGRSLQGCARKRTRLAYKAY